MNALFLEPHDVLYLRGNKLFGDAGAHGEALMPPWPSMAAGALRSRLIAEGETVETLADFRLTGFGLARRQADGTVEPLWPLPADVIVTSDVLENATYFQPTEPGNGIASSYPLPLLPVFAAGKPGKPESGLWLNRAGITAWLAAAPIKPEHLLRASQLWTSDSRLGIALDAERRSAAEGKIYTTEAIALAKDIGFVIASNGHAQQLSRGDIVRLGGDGRAATIHGVTLNTPESDWARIEREGRFRLLLTTPGIFANGWEPEGIPAQLVAASVNRAETISGWDILTGKPKPAQRIAPTGSVYWFDKLADVQTLKDLADNGLSLNDPARRAEGFNHCRIAPWA